MYNIVYNKNQARGEYTEWIRDIFKAAILKEKPSFDLGSIFSKSDRAAELNTPENLIQFFNVLDVKIDRNFQAIFLPNLCPHYFPDEDVDSYGSLVDHDEYDYDCEVVALAKTIAPVRGDDGAIYVVYESREVSSEANEAMRTSLDIDYSAAPPDKWRVFYELTYDHK